MGWLGLLGAWGLTSQAWAWPWSPPDEDGDGIRDRDDECPGLMETRNGYADEDGCPDYLRKLLVEAELDGTVVAATYRITLPDGTTTDWSADPEVAKALVPGARVRLEARLDCLAGDRVWVVRDALNRVPVRLVPRADAEVAWSVLDAEGTPVPEAQVTWLGARTAACARTGTSEITGGHSVHRVGAGEYHVRLEAPGFAPVERTVPVEAGERREVPVMLEAAAPAPEP